MIAVSGQIEKGLMYLMMGNMLTQIAMIVVSAFVFSLIYLDDFKGKTLATTIAGGQSRTGVIVVKQGTSWLISLLLYVLFGGLFFILAHVLGAGFTGGISKALLLSAVESYVKAIGYQVLAAVLVYWTQNAGVSLTILLLLASGFIHSMLGILLSLSQVKDLVGDLSPYLFTNAVTTLFSGWQAGDFDVKAFITLISYVTLPAVLTSALFSKKELSF